MRKADFTGSDPISQVKSAIEVSEALNLDTTKLKAALKDLEDAQKQQKQQQQQQQVSGSTQTPKYIRVKGQVYRRADMDSYTSLNDAVKYGQAYLPGRTRVWYTKPDYTRDFRMGLDWLKSHGPKPPNANTLNQTHVFLGSLKEADPEKVFELMQGENWSRRGEANNLIRSLGLAHTSMSVGDIIERNGLLYMVDSVGFEQL